MQSDITDPRSVTPPLSEADWNAALAEWNESIQYLYLFDSLVTKLPNGIVPESFAKRVPVSLIEQCREPKKESGRYVTYKCKLGRGTEKAEFFMTEDGDPRRGFWCPRAAIIEDIGDKVFIATWCNLTTIDYR